MNLFFLHTSRAACRTVRASWTMILAMGISYSNVRYENKYTKPSSVLLLGLVYLFS